MPLHYSSTSRLCDSRRWSRNGATLNFDQRESKRPAATMLWCSQYISREGGLRWGRLKADWVKAELTPRHQRNIDVNKQQSYSHELNFFLLICCMAYKHTTYRNSKHGKSLIVHALYLESRPTTRARSSREETSKSRSVLVQVWVWTHPQKDMKFSPILWRPS